MKRLFFVLLTWLFIQPAFAATGVWYACDANGTSDNLEAPATNITISGGVATLTEQTGNIGAGMDITYDATHHAYIAPNRIGFDSGGTTELLPGTKIAGGTSGAIGIVRYVETTSGTWSGGDAAGYIYFEENTSGTWQNDEQINRTKPTTSDNIATTDGTLQGNIGNGNTEFVVKAANGTDAANYGQIAVDSIKADYASLALLEASFEDSNHLDGNLTATDTVLFATCYTRNKADTTAVTIDFTSSDADNYFQVYTPIGEAESINSQRHEGKWDDGKYRLEGNQGYGGFLSMAKDYSKAIGIQVNNTGGTGYGSIRINANYCLVDKCITKGATEGFYNYGEYCCIRNCIGFNCANNGYRSKSYGSTGTYLINCSFIDCETGINGSSGYTRVYNTVAFGNTTNWDGAFYSGSDYNAGETADDPPGSNDIVTVTSGDFTDYANDNFHIVAISDLVDAGTDFSSDLTWPFSDDIDDDTRSGTWDIGADEYISSGPSPSFCVPIFSTDGIHSLIFGGQVIK
ncbi:hypothetical protein DRQ25_06295 [Candidatus Fermentibacteria bacterium]|nr:MAG: hypothetical protein DRQ25_06295 [Candidatus Fermentibacteria bacterium]